MAFRKCVFAIALCWVLPRESVNERKSLRAPNSVGQKVWRRLVNSQEASLAHKPCCYVPFEAILGFDPGPLTALAHDGNLFPAGQHLTVWT
jgi:hypothetical protein